MCFLQVANHWQFALVLCSHGFLPMALQPSLVSYNSTMHHLEGWIITWRRGFLSWNTCDSHVVPISLGGAGVWWGSGYGTFLLEESWVVNCCWTILHCRLDLGLTCLTGDVYHCDFIWFPGNYWHRARDLLKTATLHFQPDIISFNCLRGSWMTALQESFMEVWWDGCKE